VILYHTILILKSLDSKSKLVVLLTMIFCSLLVLLLKSHWHRGKSTTARLFTLYIRYFNLMYVCKLLSCCQAFGV